MASNNSSCINGKRLKLVLWLVICAIGLVMGIVLCAALVPGFLGEGKDVALTCATILGAIGFPGIIASIVSKKSIDPESKPPTVPEVTPILESKKEPNQQKPI